MKFFIKTTLLLGVISLSFVGCKKPGCIDSNSKDYNAKAKTDDGSCTYSGNVVFWYGKSTSEFLQNDDAITLTYYVDGQIVGSSATSVYWNYKPDCGSNASITVTEDLGISKNKSYSYKVIDQTGFVYYEGVANFTANTCTSIELD